MRRSILVQGSQNHLESDGFRHTDSIRNRDGFGVENGTVLAVGGKEGGRGAMRVGEVVRRVDEAARRVENWQWICRLYLTR